MGLETSIARLREQLESLVDCTSSLHVTVVEDQPPANSAALVDTIENQVTDLLAAAEEAMHLANEAGTLLADESLPLGEVLKQVHTLILRFGRSFWGELASHRSVESLLRMGRERGRDWKAWSHAVRTAIEQCGPPLAGVQQGLLECWRDLVERPGPNPVYFKATNINQQFAGKQEKTAVLEKAS
jgi:hypothetical protein